MREFLINRETFFRSGRVCLKLSMALFRFGRPDAHIIPLLSISNLFVVYHVGEHAFEIYRGSMNNESLQYPLN